MKRRLLHVIDSLGIGGAEKLLCNTISELEDFEHLIITLFPSKDLALLPSNAEHICLNAKKIMNLYSKRKLYKKALTDYRPDIVHAHLYFATILAKACTPFNIPLVFTQHFEFSKNAEKWYYSLTDKLLSKNTHMCIAVSKTVLKDYLVTSSFKGKTYVIANYIPDKYFAIRNNSTQGQSGQLRLVAIGNIKPIKNQQFILEAFEYLKDLNISCDIYGDGPLRVSLEHQAKASNLKVYFKGPIEDSYDVLEGYHLYIMPSLTEGFPLALFEAMASSLPVIVSDIPVFHEVLENKGNYITLSNPSQLRSVIEPYIKNSQLLQKEGEEMKKIALAKASKKIYLSKIRALYHSLPSKN